MVDNVSISKTTPMFPALQKLCLLDMPALTEWADVESRVATFPCLENLEIQSCRQLESAPTCFPCLKKLKIHEIGSNICLTNICRNTSSLQELSIEHYSGTVSLGDECFVKNRHLSSLKIGNCPNIMGTERYSELTPEQEDSNTFHGLHSLKNLRIFECPELKLIPNFDLKSLQQLVISNCPKLKSIPNFDLRSLQQLVIRNCTEVKAIPNFDLRSLQHLDISGCPALTYFPLELLESSTPFLFALRLEDLPNVENMDVVMSSISRMLRLKCLTLFLFPKFTNMPFASRSLYELEISGFSESLDVVSFNNYLKCILQECPNLQLLTIIGNKDWESLPDHVQHLHALHCLQIKDFGIQALPEWIGNLSSLRGLRVINCERLQHLPSKENMQHLTYLSIEECPLLAKRIQTQLDITPGVADPDYDSEWAKIYHIKDVFLDSKRLPTRNSRYLPHSPVQDEKKFAGCFPIPRSRKR